ncbi:unnamed protein product [Sphenostylis stenocarpa]|uniref:Uncharacterized protein n=1 Tax=Sphenostylis stenocarpa TaxID=92480 RepID=A0AA86VI32_9FABA|nr:unnamed protein product [Sphenostylis stenocarpa]
MVHLSLTVTDKKNVKKQMVLRYDFAGKVDVVVSRYDCKIKAKERPRSVGLLEEVLGLAGPHLSNLIHTHRHLPKRLNLH